MGVLAVALSAGCGLVADMDPPDFDGEDAGVVRDSGRIFDAPRERDANRADGRPVPVEVGVVEGGVVEVGPARDTSVVVVDSSITPLDGGAITPDAVVVMGCMANTECADTEYCHAPVGACLAGGSCRARPTDSACGAVDMPVCGCDGHTYPSPCAAAFRGIRLEDSLGPCPLCPVLPPVPIGCCLDDSGCATGYQCVGMACPGAGLCQPRPLYGHCWEDRDCGLGMVCRGVTACASVCMGGCPTAPAGTCFLP